MIAEAVYIIAKTLPRDEQLKLYNKLRYDLEICKDIINSETKKKILISDEEAMVFVLKTVFNK